MIAVSHRKMVNGSIRVAIGKRYTVLSTSAEVEAFKLGVELCLASLANEISRLQGKV